MGFMSHGQKHTEIRPEQKWDYIVRLPLGRFCLLLLTTIDPE